MSPAMSQSYEKSPVREYFESIVIAVILALFVRTFVVQAFKIPSGSMEDNLLVGDHLLVNKFIFAPAATSSFSSIPRTRIATSSSGPSACPARPSRSATRPSTSTASRSSRRPTT